MKNSLRVISMVIVIVMLFTMPAFALTIDVNSHTSELPLNGCRVCGSLFCTDESHDFGGSGFGGPRAYYTEPTVTEVDTSGNATNYYRSGDTTTNNIVNTVNKTFSSFQNNTYSTYDTTLNYSNDTYWTVQANVDLSNFLNTYNYTTNNHYYDVTYNEIYYSTTNNYYYVNIDASTNYDYDIYYEYHPCYTEVNYISNNSEVNNVTNIYYYELNDGRNSSTITVDEVFGLAVNYGVDNYEQVVDADNILSLQHFDGSYADSSGYQREIYTTNRATSYVDSGDFGQAVLMPCGYNAGVYIPELADYADKAIVFDVRFKQNSTRPAFYLKLGDFSLFEPKFMTDDGSMSGWSILVAGTNCTWYPLLTADQWYSLRIVLYGGTIYVYNNGVLWKSVAYDYTSSLGSPVYLAAPDYNYRDPGTYFDEFRVSYQDSWTDSTFDPPTAPFDTNLIYALPDNPVEGNIYIRSSIPTDLIRVGGVRPSSPETGFVYIPLDSSYRGAGCQIYDGSNWNDVDGYIYENETWSSVIGYKFWTVGECEDIIPDDSTTDDGTGDDGADDGDSSDDGSGLLDSLGELLTGLFDLLLVPIKAITNFFTEVVASIGDLFTLSDDFVNNIGGLWGVFPSEITSLIVAAVGIVLLIGLIKLVIGR